VKTGTSRNYRDNWTVGYTPEFTVGVWVGNFDNTPMENVSGVSGAGPIFRDIFMRLSETHRLTWFTEPSSIVHAKVDTRTGHRLPSGDTAERFVRDEIFLNANVPPEASVSDYEPVTGRAYLDAEYAGWLAKGDSWLSDMMCLRPAISGPQPPTILAPTEGLVIMLDPDLRDGGSRLMLQSRSVSAVKWSSRTLRIDGSGGMDIALLQPGRHQIVATDESSGLQSTVNIEVVTSRTRSIAASRSR
jgi:penicillin-binding protein 1C